MFCVNRNVYINPMEAHILKFSHIPVLGFFFLHINHKAKVKLRNFFVCVKKSECWAQPVYLKVSNLLKYLNEKKGLKIVFCLENTSIIKSNQPPHKQYHHPTTTEKSLTSLE